uniref:Uncharacterized protein n=1 Tax=Brassica oleracea var. oleracea TaxID=109376 RepID=A0A0D3EFV3_BRAOL
MGSLKKEGEMEQMGDEFMEAILYVNGVRKVLPDGLAHMTLLEYLRGHYAVNACLAPLYSVEGMHVISIEGVGHRKHGLHPLQTPAETSCLCLWNFVVETKHCA